MGAIRRSGQRDIAKLAEVSQSTVSIVLNGRAGERGISQSTQDRIQRAIAELGYVPDIAAQSLRGARNGLIGVHTFERVFPAGPGDYYHEFLIGVEERVVDLGLDLLLLGSTRRADGSRSLYHGKSSRIRLADGAIILGLKRDDEELERLAAEGFPFVVIGRYQLRDVKLPFVAADYQAAAAQAVAQLADLGHRRLGYLGTEARHTPQVERFDGFRAGVQDRGLTITAPEFSTPEKVDAAWLRRQLDSSVTAIVTESCVLTDAVAAVTDDQGIRIPGDLSVVTLDSPGPGSRTARWSHAPIPRRAMGQRAVDVLLGVLDGELAANHHEVLSCGQLTPGSLRQL